MIQTILNLTGIGLDLLGFVILLREWWIAVFSEKAEMQFEEAMARQADFDAFTMKTANDDRMREHMERSAKMRSDHRIQQFRTERRAMLKSRRQLYFAAVMLILLGSVLQIIGSVPAEWLPLDMLGL